MMPQDQLPMQWTNSLGDVAVVKGLRKRLRRGKADPSVPGPKVPLTNEQSNYRAAQSTHCECCGVVEPTLMASDHTHSCRHSGNNPVPYIRPGSVLGGVVRSIRGRRIRCTPEYCTSRGRKAPPVLDCARVSLGISNQTIYSLPLVPKVEVGRAALSRQC